MLLSLLLQQVSRIKFKRGIPKWLPFGILLVILIAFFYKTVQRNFEWRSDFTLWKAAVEEHPNNYYALGELGAIYLEKNLLDQAITTMEASLEANPLPGIIKEHYLNLAYAYQRKGRLDDAIRTYKRILLNAPTFGHIHYELGFLYHENGQIDASIHAFEQAVRFAENPSNLQGAHRNLGSSYAEKCKWNDAIKHYEKALKINPGDPLALHNIEIVRKNINMGKRCLPTRQ